jgi:integrase
MRYREPRIRTRGKRWQIDYINPEGRRRQLSAGYTKEGAERLRIKFISWLIDGKDPEMEAKKERVKHQLQTITIRELFPIFMDRHGRNRSLKMQESYRNSHGNICRCPHLADAPLATINQAVVLDYINARMRQDGVKPATVNREKAFLSVMLTKAMAWGYLERNTLEGMENFKEPRKRDVELTPEQAARLIEVLPTEEVKNIVAFAIYSGLRLEAILDIKIEDVVFHDPGSVSRVSIRDKGGEKEERLLSRHATEILRSSIRKREAGHVFINPRTGKRFQSRMGSFDRAVRKLGLTAKDGSKLRFHDLRHVYGNWLHQAGVSLDELRVLYGHRDRATTDRYITPDLRVIGEKLALQPKIAKKKSR